MKVRKLPIVVDAVVCKEETVVATLEGLLIARIGDYIITGVNGEKWPVKKEIFEKTYEIISED